MPVYENPPCQTEACSIQTCLSRNNYNQDRCANVVLELYKCCDEMYKKYGGQGEELRKGKGEGGKAGSTACPLRSVVDDYLQKHDK